MNIEYMAPDVRYEKYFMSGVFVCLKEVPERGGKACFEICNHHTFSMKFLQEMKNGRII